MSTTTVPAPTSRLRVGLARVDVTQPVGMYHRLWGAARHTRSTGVHRPLTAEVMVFGPTGGQPQLIRVFLDSPGLVQYQHENLLQILSDASGLPVEQIIVSYSHTHAAGRFAPDRFKAPGGELIPPYLEEVGTKIGRACRQALDNFQEALITYGVGRCNLAANRDYWDAANNIYVCGFNPDTPADDTVLVARITDLTGQLLGTVVNYACHPTTLAWGNTLISPDYVGAMREVVEQVTGATCIFTLGACGNLGPRDGFVGDTEVADRNGRQLAYAALSALESMNPPATDFEYQGPVVSGATVGTWAAVPLGEERLAQVSIFSGGTYSVELPLKPKPSRAALKQQISEFQTKMAEADARGATIEARNYNAHIERAERWFGRLDTLPEGDTFPLKYSVHRLGDALWVSCGDEPYNEIQMELRRRFPQFTLLFSQHASYLQAAYLMPKERYGLGLYQEEPSILAPGCLETLTETIAAKIDELI